MRYPNEWGADLSAKQRARQNLVTQPSVACSTWWRRSAAGELLQKPSFQAATLKDKNTLHISFFFWMRRYRSCVVSQQRSYLHRAKCIAVTCLTGHTLLIPVLIWVLWKLQSPCPACSSNRCTSVLVEFLPMPHTLPQCSLPLTGIWEIIFFTAPAWWYPSA